MNHFEYRDENGIQLHAEPLVSSDGDRYVRVTAVDCCDAAVDVDLDRLEEVIAGLRDMGRQAGQAAAPSLTAIAGTRPPAGDPGCQCTDAAACDQHLPERATEGAGA